MLGEKEGYFMHQPSQGSGERIFNMYTPFSSKEEKSLEKVNFKFYSNDRIKCLKIYAHSSAMSKGSAITAP